MTNYWYDHVHLVSPDPAKTAQFYERMFGAKVISTRQLADGRTNVELDLNGSRILVINPKAQLGAAPTPSGTGHGLGHFGLRTDNLEAAVGDLKAKGVEFTEEIRVIRPGVKISFLLGPENTLIELLEKSD